MNRRLGGAGIRRPYFRGGSVLGREAPLTISDLEAFFRTDEGVATTGSDVDSWTDKLNGHVISNTGGNRPTTTAVNALLGGNRTIDFVSASAQSLSGASSLAALFDNPSPYTVAVVAHTLNVGSQQTLWCASDTGGTTDHIRHAVLPTSGNSRAQRQSGGAADTFDNAATALSVDTTHYVTCSWSPTTVYLEIDGGAQQSGTIAKTPSSLDTFVVGARNLGGALSHYFWGYIAELLVYSRLLTSGEQDTLDAYFAARYT